MVWAVLVAYRPSVRPTARMFFCAVGIQQNIWLVLWSKRDCTLARTYSAMWSKRISEIRFLRAFWELKMPLEKSGFQPLPIDFLSVSELGDTWWLWPFWCTKFEISTTLESWIIDVLSIRGLQCPKVTTLPQFCLRKLESQKLKIRLGNRDNRIPHVQTVSENQFPSVYPECP